VVTKHLEESVLFYPEDGDDLLFRNDGTT